MARPSSVWWWDARKRWTINIHGKRKTAPATLQLQDHEAAEAWALDLLRREAPDQIPAALPDLDSPETGRIGKRVQLLPRSIRQLAELTRARRIETCEPVHPGQILDELIDAAHQVVCGPSSMPPATKRQKKTG